MNCRRFLIFASLSAVLFAVPTSALTLKWTDNSWDETEFVVERSVDGGEFVEVHRAPENVVEFKDTNVDAEKTYSYRVKAVNFAGSSNWSNTVTSTPNGAPHNVVISVEIP